MPKNTKSSKIEKYTPMSNAIIKKTTRQAKKALFGSNPDIIPIPRPKVNGKKRLHTSTR
jgi:hypothetical protein